MSDRTSSIPRLPTVQTFILNLLYHIVSLFSVELQQSWEFRFRTNTTGITMLPFSKIIPLEVQLFS